MTQYLQPCCHGSPPRMRGKPFVSLFASTHTRITPADAGKTSNPTFKPPALQDHPRGCGENATSSMSFGRSTGSPPRMRGKQGRNSLSLAEGGITPADAGKTILPHHLLSCLQDHPRGCGENASAHLLVWSRIGSPPRMRGKLPSCCSPFVKFRITPADAGKTGY